MKNRTGAIPWAIEMFGRTFVSVRRNGNGGIEPNGNEILVVLKRNGAKLNCLWHSDLITPKKSAKARAIRIKVSDTEKLSGKQIETVREVGPIHTGGKAEVAIDRVLAIIEELDGEELATKNE